MTHLRTRLTALPFGARLGALLPALLIALLVGVTAGCSSPAGYVLTNTRVHGRGEGVGASDTVVVKDGWIVAVGRKDDLSGWISPQTEVIDLGGRPIYPGFADAHLHLVKLARHLRNLDLIGTTSWNEVVEAVVVRSAEVPEGQWIVGRGWDQNDWQRQSFPHHALLSAQTPDHPAVLTRVDGHAILANARAMELAGIDEHTPDPPGGAIVRADNGAPTGVFIDHAKALVEQIIPSPSDDELRASIRDAIDLLHGQGITSIHDAGVTQRQLSLYVTMAEAGEFNLRDYVMVFPEAYERDGELNELLSRRSWLSPSDDLTGDGLLTKRAIKVSSDGALGSRGALLIEPYSDAPDTHGLELIPAEEVHQLSVEALRTGMQMCVHAIGDRANRDVLDAYQRALEEVPPHQRHGPDPSHPRFRIEHAQILAPADIPRFAELGVVPSMQALHQTSDMPWAEQRVGPERIVGAYAWRSLLDTGVIIPGGSDAPVEAPDVLAGFHAAVTRTDTDGQPEGGWYPGQVMTRDEALDSITLWPAIASHQDDFMGRIAPGQRADMVVLDRDILYLPDEDLLDVQVDLTIFDGRVVYRRERDTE